MSEETKKILKVIEKQYREERQRQEKEAKKQDNKKFLINALIFLNIVVLLILISR